ncbi:MAG: DNA-binding protein [Deltaproteobacteria bacterium HGW-Deltaproteobacteria-10]|nr:MAG: DNA-binding protein [Deltaproteobacteria bacterium HGW-Deltaproteobacteria-10]
MDDPKAEVVRLWIKKADHDLQNIANNLSAIDIPTDTLCFHAQQAIEKIFKGLLVAHGMPISKTHDLSKLLTDISQIAPELLAYEDELEEISEYSVSARYPDALYEPSLDETRSAYETAKEIRALVLEKLTQYL